MSQARNEDVGSFAILRGELEGKGLRGCTNLFRGLGPTLWRDVPFSCLYWYTYESLKRRLRSHGYGGAAGELDKGRGGGDGRLVLPGV